ncbi:MAG: DNA polymerase I [Candidatus Delongbacteria bacterium]|nr:DNA polymerase I [Candidatus Delongbacteria bacterium]MBN2833753.1 DNA polymerase I [Candidatus Delongbacteria bacterium]
MKKLFVIDGYALIYRSYFAFGNSPLITEAGINVSAIYGFFNSLIALVEKEKPEYMVLVLDPPGPTFRHIAYDQYKATRQKMPQDLKDSLPILFEMVDAFRLKTIELEGFEADDVIASISMDGYKFDYETVIYSSDKDLFQLIGDKVKIYDPRTQTLFDREKSYEKFSVYPEQIVDYLSMVGDSSDNVPGVPKIGAKTAVELLNSYGSLDNIYDNLDLIKKKAIQTTLTENRNLADLSKSLVTLRSDLNYDLTLNECSWSAPDFEKLIGLYSLHNMKGLIKQLEKMRNSETGESLFHKYEEYKVQYNRINDEKELSKLVQKLMKSERVAIFCCFDNEDLSCISISESENCSWFINFENDSPQLTLFDLNDDRTSWLNVLKPLLENKIIIGEDLKKVGRLLKKYEINLNFGYDTELAHYVLYSHESNHGIEKISYKLFNYEMINSVSVFGSGRSSKTANEADSEMLKIFCCERSDFLLKSFRSLKDLVKKKSLDNIFKLEMEILPILLEMEIEGVLLDRIYMESLKNEFKLKTDQLRESIFQYAGRSFNPDSPKQLGEVLFEDLMIVGGKKGKSGSYTTDASVLEKLSKDGYKIADVVLQYRELMKLTSTFIDGLLSLADDNDRIHTKFNQTIAATGRLSSTEPNIQNIPVKTEQGEKIRKSFIAKDGYKLLAADYSQIELRVLAHYCKDEALIKAFKDKVDIHTMTASVLFDIGPELVTREMRSKAKVANFSIIYGKTKFGLSEDLGISFDEASKFIDNYFGKFAGIKTYIDETTKFVLDNGYVETVSGRVRVIPESRSDNKNVKNHAIRAAVNTPIQGTAADIIKYAMINVNDIIKRFDAKLLLQVHDELVFEVREEDVDRFSLAVKEAMENVKMIDVPLEVNIGLGCNWLEAH